MDKFVPYGVGVVDFKTQEIIPPDDGKPYYTEEEMNYHRKQWEKEKKKSNPIAKELREFKPKIIPDKRKINLHNLKDFIDDE